ncbi:MAG: 5-formyltetrahydrofolate cyclo-ligase [Cryobacterium sp.]|nr:5-formyltetrahydrofolate cyclo-ligase [Cryobacterium sp.]HNP15251.1 5-formyltetrahydrofolate cyclo-ligase [Terrimesophilobacter sp.]
MSGDEGHQKRALRAELRGRRRTMTATELESATAGFTQNLVDLVTDLDAHYIAAYLPAQDEPNIRPFLAWAQEQEIRVLLPVSRDDGLLDWAVSSDAEQEGLYGMPEPVGDLLGPIAINDVDLILVPAAAVDRTGMRLGWGRGYFDRTLGSMEKCPPVYAIIFDGELVGSVPTELHDKRVNGVVTPDGITTFPATTD